MIRLVKIDAMQEIYGTSPSFAFFNTRTLKFLEFYGEQIWSDIEDLVGAWNLEEEAKIDLDTLTEIIEDQW